MSLLSQSILLSDCQYPLGLPCYLLVIEQQEVHPYCPRERRGRGEGKGREGGGEREGRGGREREGREGREGRGGGRGGRERGDRGEVEERVH